MRNVCLGLALATLLSAPAHAQQSPSFPKTPVGWYSLGESFARCTASAQLEALVLRQRGHANAATAAEDTGRGWSLAGMFVLANGLEPGVQNQTQRLFNDLVAADFNKRKGRLELSGTEAYYEENYADFKKECEPLAPMQEAIIAAMRRSAPPR